MGKCDVLVVGAGAAGLAAAEYSSRSGLDTMVLEGMAPGGQLMLIAEIENYPGLGAISGFELASKFEEQAERFGAKIVYAEAQAIEKAGKSFLVRTDSEDIEAKAIILAMGAEHKKLSVPGEKEFEGKGVSYCATCDGPFFKGKDVVAVGGGDTALTEALYLSKLCKSVTLVHRRDEFRAQKILVDRAMKAGNIKFRMPSQIKEIKGEGKVSSVLYADGEKQQADAVFVFVGINPRSALANGIISLDERGYIIVDGQQRTNVDGIFAAGDVTNSSFKQVVTAASAGAVAAHSAGDYVRALPN